jgi:hypothetical protein
MYFKVLCWNLPGHVYETQTLTIGSRQTRLILVSAISEKKWNMLPLH